MSRTTSSEQTERGSSLPQDRPPSTAGAPSPTGQEGFTLAALIVILTVMAIFIAYTVPAQWSMVMKRERDRQTIFLMKQYARGILRWQQKHNAAPASLEQMQEARKPVILRNGGKWACPLTGSEKDWILVPPGAVLPNGQLLPNPNAGGVMGRNQPLQPQQPQQGTERMPSKLNKELSPKDYVGQFVGVRPNATGPSFIELNGATDYSEWVYTVEDLKAEIQARQSVVLTR